MFSLPADYRLKREQGLAAPAIGMSLDIQSPFLMGNTNSGPCNWRERGCQLTAAVSSTIPDKIMFNLLTFRLSVAQTQHLPVGTLPLGLLCPWICQVLCEHWYAIAGTGDKHSAPWVPAENQDKSWENSKDLSLLSVLHQQPWHSCL